MRQSVNSLVAGPFSVRHLRTRTGQYVPVPNTANWRGVCEPQLTVVTRMARLAGYRMSKSKSESTRGGDDRDLYSGLIRLHILHHAARESIFGLGMAEELARHGYKISAGTLYPILYGLKKKGYLHSSQQRNGKSLRKVYRATPLGRRALAAAKSKIRELFGELIEGR